MSKFDVMAGQPVVIAQYNVYCDEFEFHSDHYECTCNGSDFTIDFDSYPNTAPLAKFYDARPDLGDIIELLGISNSFIVEGVTRENPNNVVGTLKLSILTGVADHG